MLKLKKLGRVIILLTSSGVKVDAIAYIYTWLNFKSSQKYTDRNIHLLK